MLRLPPTTVRGTLSADLNDDEKEKAVTTIAPDAGREGAGPVDEGGDAPAAERIAEHAHRRVDQAAARAADAEREIREAAADVADRFRRTEAEVSEVIDQNLSKIRDYIEKNPIQSAGIAFAAGIVLSSLLRR